VVVKNPNRTYHVYMMASLSQTLYTGVPNDLERRVAEHKSGAGSEFVSRYRVTGLVYFEEFSDFNEAITREKQIKGLLRVKNFALVESMNPAWKDLNVEEKDRDSSLRRLRSE
jgi:putative endonuclease